MIRRNIGRPTSILNEPSLQTETACSTKSLRSSTDPCIKTLCIIFQKRKTSEDTHKLLTTRKGWRYLSPVMLDLQTARASKDERTFDEKHNDTANVKSDIEIISIMKYELMHLTASTLDMNNVNNTYIEYWKTEIAAILKSIINHT